MQKPGNSIIVYRVHCAPLKVFYIAVDRRSLSVSVNASIALCSGGVAGPLRTTMGAEIDATEIIVTILIWAKAIDSRHVSYYYSLITC